MALSVACYGLGVDVSRGAVVMPRGLAKLGGGQQVISCDPVVDVAHRDS
jgi:hypothetical protein